MKKIGRDWRYRLQRCENKNRRSLNPPSRLSLLPLFSIISFFLFSFYLFSFFFFLFFSLSITYNTIRHRRSNALNPLLKGRGGRKAGERRETNSLNFSRFISSRLARFGEEIPDTPASRSLGVWMAIDFPLSSSASLLLTTNIHEVIRVIDIHWATAEAEDKCVMLAKGEVEISHMRPPPCVRPVGNVRAMHVAPSSRVHR